jgi:ParB family chromosome partitioning protein
MNKKKRLGRGLEALLSASRSPDAFSHEPPDVLQFPGSGDHASTEATAGSSSTSDVVYLSVYDIDDNPFQPRRDFSEAEIGSLAESLKTHDMLQPILVRVIDGRHQLISGERRLRAAIQAGWSKIPARVRQADDRLVAELAIVENLQRKDLNAIEKALSFRRYLNEHHATQDELAQRLKIDRSTVANLMRLLELPPSVQEALRGGAITAGHARALLPLGEEPLQVDFCQRIQREGFSVRQTEQMVTELIEDLDQRRQNSGKPRRKRTKSQQIESLELQLKQSLGTRVDIRQLPSGRGKITIHFPNADEFERVHRILSGKTGNARAA